MADEGTTSELGEARRNGRRVLLAASAFLDPALAQAPAAKSNMEAKRSDGSPAVVFVDPKTQTIVDADFR